MVSVQAANTPAQPQKKKEVRAPLTPEEIAKRAEQLKKRIAEEMIKVEAVVPQTAPAKPQKARKLLIFTLAKGFVHDSIPLAAQTFTLMGKKTGAYETVVTDDPQAFAPEKLECFDAVLMDSTTGTPLADKALQQSLLAFVKSGKGIAGIHAATDSFGSWADYGEMMGGYFAGHPFHPITVKIDDPASPINAVFKGQGFDISDEIYIFRPPYSREKLHILLSIDYDKSKKVQDTVAKMVADKKAKPRADDDYAVSWIHQYGQGRVFYCSLGHVHETYWNPAILSHYLAGVQYALGDLPADATPSVKK